MKDHQQFKTKVLDFWKTLDDDQKVKVSKAFTEKQDRMGKRMQDKRDGQRGGQRAPQQ